LARLFHYLRSRTRSVRDRVPFLLIAELMSMRSTFAGGISPDFVANL